MQTRFWPTRSYHLWICQYKCHGQKAVDFKKSSENLLGIIFWHIYKILSLGFSFSTWFSYFLFMFMIRPQPHTGHCCGTSQFGLKLKECRIINWILFGVGPTFIDYNHKFYNSLFTKLWFCDTFILICYLGENSYQAQFAILKVLPR